MLLSVLLNNNIPAELIVVAVELILADPLFRPLSE